MDRRVVGPADSAAAARQWWDASAAEYWAEHRDFLGDRDFVWCPEGLREVDLGLLGEVRSRRVLELGCGTAPCTRWLTDQGASAVGLDISAAMLDVGRELDLATSLIQADAAALPFRDSSFDLVCSSYGALPFLPELTSVFAGVARVLRPGGRFVFSLSHPIRWCFPDDPGPRGLTATNSYWDRRAYAEFDANGAVSYAEHHHTMADLVDSLVTAGFNVERLIEPDWPDGNHRTWGGWSSLRGRHFPGTAIFVGGLRAGG